MRRIHAFELEDQPWFPRVLRDAGMAFLRLAAEKAGQADSIRPVIEDALSRSGESEILDLCSGGGGPIASIARQLRDSGRDVSVTMTDLYPSESARARLAAEGSDHLAYDDTPVDATAVPGGRPGLRTMFNAFHHFREPVATAVLANAVNTGRPIAVVEVFQRRAFMALGMLLMPLIVLLAVPFLRPFRPSWLVLTYLLPLIPLYVWWDGTISMLRAYRPDEARRLIAQADPEQQFQWTVTSIDISGSIVPGLAVVGIPARPTANE